MENMKEYLVEEIKRYAGGVNTSKSIYNNRYFLGRVLAIRDVLQKTGSDVKMSSYQWGTDRLFILEILVDKKEVFKDRMTNHPY